MAGTGIEVVPIPKVDEDARRTIFEIESNFGKIVRKTILFVKEGSLIGNHYHRECTENFLLLSGKVRLWIREIGQSGMAISEENKIYEVEAPALITIKPFLAHRFVCDCPTTLVCDADRPFNPEDAIPFLL